MAINSSLGLRIQSHGNDVQLLSTISKEMASDRTTTTPLQDGMYINQIKDNKCLETQDGHLRISNVFHRLYKILCKCMLKYMCHLFM